METTTTEREARTEYIAAHAAYLRDCDALGARERLDKAAEAYRLAATRES